jgi:hypothetical protein
MWHVSNPWLHLFLTHLKPEYRRLAAAVVHLQQQWQWLTAAAAVSALKNPTLQSL